MESIEVTRRLKNQTTAKRCYFCDGEEFDSVHDVAIFKNGVAFYADATVCVTCGHIDLFRKGTNANKNGSN